jgi:hypothetical protein
LRVAAWLFFVLCAAIGVIAAAIGFSHGAVLPGVLGLACALGAGWLARIVKQGRSPNWLQSPLDRWWSRD